jgi:aspartate racemase
VANGQIIGILGGMGPAATADFYSRLVALTPVRRDQDHVRTVIWSDPTIPDRTEALLGLGADPTPSLRLGARVLRDAGATMIAIPCITAHAFAAEVEHESGLPVVHMIDEVTRHLTTLQPPARTVGLLATSGTLHAGLHKQWIDHVDIVLPDPDSQEDEVMAAIRAVKAGERGQTVTEPLQRAATRLIEAGAQAIIAGCTEIPLVLAPEAVPVPLLDPAEILARALIRRALEP